MIVQIGGRSVSVQVQSSGYARALAALAGGVSAQAASEAAAAAASASQIAAAADAVLTAADAVATAADRVQTGLDRVATGGDVIATAADVVLTGADAAQTALDRIATAADAVSTGDDATATAADAVATAADAVATAADRVQTGLDRIATAADVAATADKVSLTALAASTGAAGVGSINTGTGATSRTVQAKLRDFPAFPADYSTTAEALANANGTLFPSGVNTITAALTPTAKTIIKGAGRENTFVRMNSTAVVFDSTSNFVSYEDLTIDRTGAVAGKGIYHRAANPAVGPLEGFDVKRVNVNGHTTGIDLGDVVIGRIEDSYIQNCATGLTVGITGTPAATCLAMKNTWLRANTVVGASITSLINLHADQAVFESGPKGVSVSACGAVLFTSSWWESLNLCGEFVNCSTVTLYGGALDGSALVSRGFYFNGATTPTTVIFDGPWRVENMSATFATADTGATIYVRSPELAAYNWQATGGGKVIFDVELEASTTWDPPSCASLTKTASTTVTVAGVTLGDQCEAFFENGSSDPQLFYFKADCFGTDTVTVAAFNMHSSTVDLASGTLTVRARKRALTS